MALSRSERRDHLRLVARNTTGDLASRLTDPAVRREFEQLTQALIDALIEMMDIVDGDSDVELNGDELEPEDSV